MKNTSRGLFFLLVVMLSVLVRQAVAADVATLDAIRHCRDFIRKAQLDDGAFRVALKGDRMRVWPYFGNVAARALLVAHKLDAQGDDFARVRRWLDWYSAHMREDGMIRDFYGTVTSYEPTTKRDAIDVYPPTYLAALWRYQQARPGDLSNDELRRRGELSLRAIESALDPADDLTWSSNPHRYKYPMDNIDVCIGLIEGAKLFTAIGAQPSADKCLAIVGRMRAAIAKFWLADQHYFAWVQGNSAKTRTFEKPYPDGVANIYLAACTDPPQPKLWKKLQETFRGSPRLTPDLWLAAAQRCGTPEEIKQCTLAAIERATSDDLDLQVASRLLLALAGDLAEPTIVPLPLPLN